MYSIGFDSQWGTEFDPEAPFSLSRQTSDRWLKVDIEHMEAALMSIRFEPTKSGARNPSDDGVSLPPEEKRGGKPKVRRDCFLNVDNDEASVTARKH